MWRGLRLWLRCFLRHRRFWRMDRVEPGWMHFGENPNEYLEFWVCGECDREWCRFLSATRF